MKRKVNPLITAISNQIDEYKNQAKEQYKRAIQLTKERMKIRGIFAPIFTDLAKNDSVFVYMYHGEIQFSVYLHELESFKDERLTTLLSRAMDTISSNVTETDYAKYDFKEYRIRNNNVASLFDCASSVVFDITAYIKSDSPTCRKVQVGTEIKEIPKYKFICE